MRFNNMIPFFIINDFNVEFNDGKLLSLFLPASRLPGQLTLFGFLKNYTDHNYLANT
jgi:hypothetical protein